jgi:hypothetical protein
MWSPCVVDLESSLKIKNDPDHLCVEAERYANSVMLTLLEESVRPLPLMGDDGRYQPTVEYGCSNKSCFPVVWSSHV